MKNALLTYQDRIFTLHEVGWPGVKHLGDGENFDALIESAKWAGLRWNGIMKACTLRYSPLLRILSALVGQEVHLVLVTRKFMNIHLKLPSAYGHRASSGFTKEDTQVKRLGHTVGFGHKTVIGLAETVGCDNRNIVPPPPRDPGVLPRFCLFLCVLEEITFFEGFLRNFPFSSPPPPRWSTLSRLVISSNSGWSAVVTVPVWAATTSTTSPALSPRTMCVSPSDVARWASPFKLTNMEHGIGVVCPLSTDLLPSLTSTVPYQRLRLGHYRCRHSSTPWREFQVIFHVVFFFAAHFSRLANAMMLSAPSRLLPPSPRLLIRLSTTCLSTTLFLGMPLLGAVCTQSLAGWVLLYRFCFLINIIYTHFHFQHTV